MEITTVCRERMLTLTLHGELDHHGANGLIERLDRAIEASLPLQLVMDMKNVSFMDSSGIAVVMRAKQRMRELGGTLALVHVPAQPKKVFDASGISRIVAIE